MFVVVVIMLIDVFITHCLQDPRHVIVAPLSCFATISVNKGVWAAAFRTPFRA